MDAGRRRSGENPPDLRLEQYLLGELPPDIREEIRRLAETDPGVRARLEALRRSNEEILAAHPSRLVAAEVERRSGSRSPAWRWSAMIALPVAAAAVLVLWLAGPFRTDAPVPRTPGMFQDPGENPDGLPPESVRLKGEPRLLLFLDADGEVRPIEDGASVRPGDVLQLRYMAGGRKHGMILSVDGRGMVTLHFPESETGSTALGHTGSQALQRSYELDEAPDFERFFFVTSDGPVPVAEVLDSARMLGAQVGETLPLAPELRQTSVTVRKPPAQEE